MFLKLYNSCLFRPPLNTLTIYYSKNNENTSSLKNPPRHSSYRSLQVPPASIPSEVSSSFFSSTCSWQILSQYTHSTGVSPTCLQSESPTLSLAYALPSRTNTPELGLNVTSPLRSMSTKSKRGKGALTTQTVRKVKMTKLFTLTTTKYPQLIPE